MRNVGANLRLPIWGIARVEHDGRRLPVGRKGLALLYYLALEGSSSRSLLADILWDNPNGRGSLRGELHRLRAEISCFDRWAFNDNQDPLTLPATIVLDTSPGPGTPLEGLDDITPEYQSWLDVQRARLAGQPEVPRSLEAQAAEVAADLHPPGVLFLGGLPGAGQRRFGMALAERYGMPFLEGLHGSMPAVRFIRAPYPEGALETVLADKSSVFVIERPPFGETPRFEIGLKSEYPQNKLRERVLEPLPWPDVRIGILHEMPFEAAARAFLATRGNLGHLMALVEMEPVTHWADSPSASIPSPTTIMARLQNEARYLSLEGRLALERASIHPGPLSPGLERALLLDPHLDELERRGWLSYDGQWRFISDPVRQLVYKTLQPGRRARFHQLAAEHLGESEQLAAQAYHQSCGGEAIDWDTLRESVKGWARAVLDELRGWLGEAVQEAAPSFEVPGRELAMAEPRLSGHNLAVMGTTLVWTCDPLQPAEAVAEFEVEPDVALVRLRGRAHVDNPLAVGLGGDSVPLKVRVVGPSLVDVVLASVRKPALAGTTLVLPATAAFDYWLRVPHSSLLTISSRADSAVIELDVSTFAAPRASSTRGEPVRVFRPPSVV